MKASLCLGLLTACAVAQEPKLGKPEAAAAVMAAPLAEESRPGMVRWITFSPPAGWESAELRCHDKAIKHAPTKNAGERFAYIAESYFSEIKPHTCRLAKGKEERPLVAFTVKPHKFPEERLKVDFRKIKLSPKDQERAAKEQVMLNGIYASSAPLPYFSAPFKAPLDSTITSIYGSRRLYNKRHRSQHLGTDFRAAVGVPVPAANRGRVLFAGDLFYTGGTVIIDHGLDIFTVYGHLSEVKSEDGQVVNQGDIIGLSGNTGRSSGPHLHWGVKIHGNYVDGYSLIEESKRQFP